MELAEFCNTIRGKAAHELADEFLQRDVVAAFPSAESYTEFKESVLQHYASAEFVAVAGTAKWAYSLNPKKDFKPYGKTSDIDTVVVSTDAFTRAWDELRAYDRRYGFQLSRDKQERLRRNGQNVYAGFVSPKWIPDRGNSLRYLHERILNELSDHKVDFKPVKMLLFRNWAEAVAYYTRGFRIARGKLLQ